MDIIRKELKQGEMLPPGMRYDEDTDTIQVLIDDVWVDAPERDPRSVDPASAPDDRCDGAARMSAFLQDTIQGIIDGVDDDKSDAEIALIVLGVLALIPFVDLLYVLVAALVGALIIAGSSFLHAAFDDFVWDDLTQVIYCDLREDGFITDAGFTKLFADITAAFDTDPASILNDVLSIIGRGGLNDAAALRTETGDCSGYAVCGWTHRITPDNNELGHIYASADPIIRCDNGAYRNNGVAALNVQTKTYNVWYWSLVSSRRTIQLRFRLQITGETTVTGVTFYFRNLAGGNLDTVLKEIFCFNVPNFAGGCLVWAAGGSNPAGLTFSASNCLFEGYIFLDENAAVKDFCIDYVEFAGTGVDPFLSEQ